ncbi:MAG: prolipoprotein diacylglyceryl transferase family protein, partial [Acidobacteriota bacterium]
MNESLATVFLQQLLHPAFGFVLGLGVVFAALLAWAWRTLPSQAQWQTVAALPRRRDADGAWKGVTVTWYGVIVASAYVVGLLVFILLLGAVGISGRASLVMVLLLIGVCAPMSRLIATWVEGSAHGFTVGGASFVGFLLGPVVFLVAGQTPWFAGRADALLVYGLAGAAVGYTIGEGVGRMACMSFGCCYGRRISSLPAPLARVFAPIAFRFGGANKKACYADGLEHVPLVPVQGISSAVLTTIGLGGLALVLAGQPHAAVMVTLIGSQLWRVLSEVLRADDRGGARFSPYQWMALSVAASTPLIVQLLPAVDVVPQLGAGLVTLWDPALLLVVQVCWLLLVRFMAW